MNMHTDLKRGSFREAPLDDPCPLCKEQKRPGNIWEWTSLGTDGSMSAHGLRCRSTKCPWSNLLSVSSPGHRELDRARYMAERTLYVARVMAIVALVSIAANVLLVGLLHR